MKNYNNVSINNCIYFKVIVAIIYSTFSVYVPYCIKMAYGFIISMCMNPLPPSLQTSTWPILITVVMNGREFGDPPAFVLNSLPSIRNDNTVAMRTTLVPFSLLW
jgi:hypothetical protein